MPGNDPTLIILYVLDTSMSTATAESVGVISVRIIGVLLLFLTALSWLSVLVSPAQETLTAALTLSFLCGVLLGAAYLWGEYL